MRRQRMNPAGYAMLVALAGAVVVGACFPSVQYSDDSGVGGTASTSVTSDASSSSTGPPSCLIGDLGGCGPGMKCSVLDLATGVVGCTQAGSRQWFSRCALDTDCIEGAFCDPAAEVCKPFCSSSNGCVFGGGSYPGECLPLTDGAGNDVPGGHNLCIPNCDPKTGEPCDTTDYVNCVFAGAGRFDCTIGEDKIEGSLCDDSAECGAGLVCSPGASGQCVRWCTPVDGASLDCEGLGVCSSFNPSIKYLGVSHGFCPPP